MGIVKDLIPQSDISKQHIQRDGSFQRAPSVFRSTIEKGGHFDAEAGQSIHFPAVESSPIEPLGRYHLYVSYACREYYLQRSTLANVAGQLGQPGP
jgi:putative glutathione S-transferase